MARDHRTEARILEGCRVGDPDAVRDLVVRHQRFLFRVAGRLVGRWDVAEEIVQESFMRAFERIHDIDPEQGARGWLLRTVINLSRNWTLHSSQREEARPLSPDAEPIFAGAFPGPEGEAMAAERRERLGRALGELPAPLREVVVLHYIEDMPFDAISKATGIATASLRMRALRARLRLRDLLDREDA